MILNDIILVLAFRDGIETGNRQLIRDEPLEVETIETQVGPLRVPTSNEILRIKAALILGRNTTRDCIDFAALSASMTDDRAWAALQPMDRLYPQPNGESPLVQLARQLSNPRPYDLEGTNLDEYKNLVDRWRDWNAVTSETRRISGLLLVGMANLSAP